MSSDRAVAPGRGPSPVPGRRRRRVLALLAVLVAVLAVLVAGALYFRLGWWRMESSCGFDDAAGRTSTSVSYDWRWRPLGFTCTYDDGSSRTSLWF